MGRLIVDGYNLLHGSTRYARMAERDLDAARERLIADLGARAAEGEDVTVVFDGAGNPVSDGQPHIVGGVRVIFSSAGTDADSVIEGLAAEARRCGDETMVVTSDGATRWTALGGSVVVSRSPGFAAELAQDESDWKEHANGRTAGQRRRSTVEDRLDESTRDRLSRLRRDSQADR
jgi:uncharacterized protein